MSKSFSVFVRERRRQLGLTQRQVAEALGLKSIAFLSDVEAGNRKPSRDLLPALARILQTDIETLRSHDIRSPLAEVRALLEAHPEYAVAFRRVIEYSRDLGADEVLRRIERGPETLKAKSRHVVPAVEARQPTPPRRRKIPAPDTHSLLLE